MDPIATHFWEGCAQGELRYQRCASCDRAQFYPRPFCATCGHQALHWAVTLGAGVVYTATEIIRAPTPDFKALVPYTLLLVDLDEGVRMMAHGTPGLTIGQRIEVEFIQHGALHLPFFHRA